ncbi:hypothetical protein JXZ92_03220 [Mycoplasma sp. CSL10137]|uniref:hypothetical protein n=1 Tax=Mycoplasma sp. CSL10137 TaxID=2813824 RepID=UPI00197B41FB|nr:hypothetical protein [Mycoplasma sp. CSL10137]MBN4083811.1 hypothetical protein [Mycoplasma sp. CSL10137]
MVFDNYDLPEKVYSDNRTTMHNAHNHETRVARALREKGVELLSSSRLTFKPNVERSFKAHNQIIHYFS